MDNFEKHIRRNAAQFDDHQADRDKMWANIAHQLEVDRPQVRPLWKSPILKMVAALLLLFGTGSLITYGILKANSAVEPNYASKELLDIDKHYQGLVSFQVQLVRNHPKLSEEDKAEFLSFMDELDAEYLQLRSELQNNLDNELVLEAIVSNYKQRIALIENLLKQINDSKLQEDDYGYTL